MTSAALFYPALAMVALTAIVLFRMYAERVRQVKAENIQLREIPSGSQMAARFADTRAADNYKNLFEMPVLFYLALAMAHAGGHADMVVVVLAWVYVALRCVHSFIHCGYNRIGHRLRAFVASNLVLWTLWIVLAVEFARA